MQFQKISTILIWSENWKPLADWYQQTFALVTTSEGNHPQDTGRNMAFPEEGVRIWVGQHSEVKGQSLDPCRIMFNINVDSVSAAHKYLVEKSVPCIAPPFKAFTFDKWFATYSDPDGNYFQIIGPEI